MDPAINVARRYAAIVELNLEWVEGLRKDFLTLMKNLPRVKDYKEAHRLREAFNIYAERFDNVFFENFLNREFKYDVHLEEADRKWFDRELRKIAWSFYIELRPPINFSSDYYSEESRFAEYAREYPKWSNRLKDKARDFWKEMKKFIEWYERTRHKSGYPLKVRDEERVEMEGFAVRVIGYDPEHADEMERFKEGLKHFRERASKVLPMMLQHMLPIHLLGYSTLDEGGLYNVTYIEFALTSFHQHKNPNIVAHVLAHEMGHHLFRNYLSEADRKFWYETVREDSEPLDVQRLLDVWPEGAWAHELVDKLKDVDPLMALQIDVISNGQSKSGGSDFSTREDFEALLAKGIKFYTVKHPITGYAGKNAEEAFCETLGLLVGFGPATVQPIVRHWLQLIMPGVKTAAVNIVSRVALRYASYFRVGDVILMGKYKNARGKIVAFGQDKWGNPTVVIEPIPKGRKQNKIIGLYKIWRADVKENVLKKQQAEEAARAGNDPGSTS